MVCTKKLKVSFYVAAARIPDFCAFNNIAQRLISGFRSTSSLKVRLHRAYHPRFEVFANTRGGMHNDDVSLGSNVIH